MLVVCTVGVQQPMPVCVRPTSGRHNKADIPAIIAGTGILREWCRFGDYSIMPIPVHNNHGVLEHNVMGRAYSFVACGSHSTTDRTSLSKRSTCNVTGGGRRVNSTAAL